ncbi:MAG TPA: cytochrome c oxidase subunit II [Bdellovibrionota bacterium]|nr:cytochrome c oxidase subunit II [Bdellovibrionota bacterium]
MGAPLYGHWLPVDISTHGPLIDRLFNVMHVFMAVLFVGWFAFFVFTLVKFRSRPGHKAVYAPKHTKFSTYLEVSIALFEAAVLLFLAIPAWNYAKASVPKAQNVLPIHVIAEQFAWNIHYAGDDGKFGRTKPDLITTENPIGLDPSDPAAKDDLTTINQLHFPVHRPVVIHLSSKDVIHSFSIPVLRVKQDVVPGMMLPVWFEAMQTGNFEIACAQLCGLGHYRMKGFVTVETEEQFSTWLKEQRAESEEGN